MFVIKMRIVCTAFVTLNALCVIYITDFEKRSRLKINFKTAFMLFSQIYFG
jgi:hypothetical protein